MIVDLPFAIGDTVYMISPFRSGVLEDTVTGYTIEKQTVILRCSNRNRNLAKLGITLFGDRATAEAELERLRE